MIKEFKGRTNTTNKINNCKGIKDIYNYYKFNEKRQTKNKVNYNTFRDILYKANKLIANYILDGFEVKLPNVGRMQILKYNRDFNIEDKHKWPIDWKRSKLEGFLCYHKQHFTYKWRWIKNYDSLKNKGCYNFKACRTNTRRVNEKILKEKIDYFKG